MRPSVVVGLALAGLVGLPHIGATQGFHPRWEIPGFDISKDGAWRVKARRVAAERARLLSRGDFGGLNAPMAAGPSASGPLVTGVIYVPMVLFYYQDTPQGPDTSQYNAVLFGTTPPFGRPYTLRTYYEQLAAPVAFSMQGAAIGWALLDSAEMTYTGDPATSSCSGPGGNCNGVFSGDAQSRMQRGLREALSKVDGWADFRAFDNDGPDGFPNSGDDDGYVDMIGFAHATKDGACATPPNNHIWAHRWVLGAGDGGGSYVTNDVRGSGGPGNIRIRDYFIQSGLGGADACTESEIMPIGTAAHEFGHALGLPDLYDTQGSTEGVGRWSLMGSGNYSSPNSPARMEAWSLNELGWVTVAPLTVDGTHSFGASQTSDTVFFVSLVGSNPRSENFLLENRQRVLADTALMRNACQVWFQDSNATNCPGGLLIWHIDGAKITSAAPSNQVNYLSPHGVKLEEADGARDLWCPGLIPQGCNRGDAGDPYPGVMGNTAFTYTTNPAAVKNADGGYVGFDIDQITQVVPDGEMSFRLTFATPLVIQTVNPRPAGVMGASYSDRLEATGGGGTYTWSVVAGALPSGVTLAPSGLLSGVPGASGTFAYTARVSSGGQLETRDYSISVTTPALTLASVLARLFDPAAATLSADEIRYLDLNGNNNGQLDVGDFKAWLDAGGGS